MKVKEKIARFKSKWGFSGIERSLERKRARRAAKKSMPVISNAKPQDFLAGRFLSTAALPVFHELKGAFHAGKRLNLVTDSVNAGSLYGGVGTALILACEVCRYHGASLRIITRTEPAERDRLIDALRLYDVRLPEQYEFIFAPPISSGKIVDVGEKDIFLTTSWWTTESVLRSISPCKIRYLIQEDERMFYPHGDDRLRCDSILQNPAIPLYVNSSLLHEYFEGEEILRYKDRAQYFEPAFPESVYFPRVRGGKRKFFFYARPNNPRNLFAFGSAVIVEAVRRGVLPLENWEILFVGKDIPEIELRDGFQPTRVENLRWSEYAELIGTIDVGLSLMYTPHPSYPPLDLAASGAIVVTNRFANKQNLSRYSSAIITADLNVDAMVSAIAAAIEQSDSRQIAQESPSDKQSISSSWSCRLEALVKNFSFESYNE